MMTLYPALTSSTTVWLPMKPRPPVTRTYSSRRADRDAAGEAPEPSSSRATSRSETSGEVVHVATVGGLSAESRDGVPGEDSEDSMSVLGSKGEGCVDERTREKIKREMVPMPRFLAHGQMKRIGGKQPSKVGRKGASTSLDGL